MTNWIEEDEWDILDPSTGTGRYDATSARRRMSALGLRCRRIILNSNSYLAFPEVRSWDLLIPLAQL